MRAQRINDSNEKGADIEIIFVDCEDKTKTKPTLFTLEIKTKMEKKEKSSCILFTCRSSKLCKERPLWRFLRLPYKPENNVGMIRGLP